MSFNDLTVEMWQNLFVLFACWIVIINIMTNIRVFSTSLKYVLYKKRSSDRTLLSVLMGFENGGNLGEDHRKGLVGSLWAPSREYIYK